MTQKDNLSAFSKVSAELKDVMTFFDTIKEEYADLHSKLPQLEKDNADLKRDNSRIQTQFEQTSKELKKIALEYKEIQQENQVLKEENFKMKTDLDQVSKELEKVSKDFEHLTKEKDTRIAMREILALSMTLLIEVFGAQPHSKLLFLLHGQKVDMDRDSLAKASGISPAMVRKALADLDAAKLIKYDVETGIVELLKRIY